MTKLVNYTDAQVALIVAAVAANDGVADKSVAETLAADPRMNTEDGKGRKARSIIAKMTRMDEISYTKAAKLSKTGKPVQKKLDLVAQIATLSGITAAALEGLDNAPKRALDAIVEAFGDMQEAA